MLKRVYKTHQLSFSKLMEVYLEGNLEKSGGSYGEALLRMEQDFYDYLDQTFFRTPGAEYVIWEEQGAYASALRLEPYRDGLLISALETAPDLRRKGFAKTLLKEVQREYSDAKLYSHIAKDNFASLALHEALGFRKIADHSAYIDGSVNCCCITCLWENNTAID